MSRWPVVGDQQLKKEDGREERRDGTGAGGDGGMDGRPAPPHMCMCVCFHPAGKGPRAYSRRSRQDVRARERRYLERVGLDVEFNAADGRDELGELA